MARTWNAPRVTQYTAGPWVGMRQHVATKTDVAKYAEMLLNGYIRSPDTAPLFEGRPGFTAVGGGPLGGNGQLVYLFTRQDQSKFRIAISGGKFYTYATGTDTFAETLTAAHFSAASITLSAFARCYAVTFANTVIVSDGINPPWSWDGTAGAGLTKLTACPVLYGQPWVRSARLCGIVGTTTADRKSFCWSEVGDPTIGYGTAPYSANIWDVVQTSSAIFYAGTGTNDAMIIARANSVTRILGEIDTSWQTTSTKEGVHEYVGTLSPAGMLVHQDTTYFFANDGRIMRVRPGGPAEEIAVGAREFMARQSVSKFTVVDSVVWDAGSSGEYLLWIVAGPEADDPNTVLVVDPRQDELVGVWSGWQQTCWGSWEDGQSNPVLVHIGGSTAGSSAGGHVYVHGTPTGVVWNDGFTDLDTPIVHTVRSHSQGMSEVTEKYWDLIDVSLIPSTALTDLNISVRTPYGVTPALITAATPSSGARWDIDLFDAPSAVFGGAAEEQKVSVGVDVVGRWAQAEITHRTLNETFVCQSVVLRGQVSSTDPTVA